jgi:hypothetical protein
LRPANSLELAFLQDPQKRGLSLGQQFDDFIEKDRAAISQFEAPEPSLRRAGKGPPLVAEQF